MSRTILIIDDREEDIKLIKKLLSQENLDFKINTAASGEDGIEAAQEYNPNIILLDTLMPGINGWETCEALKKLPRVTSRVIMMTGSLDAVNEGKAEQAGADGYCVKFADSILAALLEQIA